MPIFKRKKKPDDEEIREKDKIDENMFRPDDPAASLAKAFGLPVVPMTFEKAMQLPPVAASIEFISSICARVPIKLYRENSENGSSTAEEITSDKRVDLLNYSTGDTLNAYQMKKAWVTDYFSHGQGYIYAHKVGNEWRSLHYVEQRNISISINTDPIFKAAEIFVAGRPYFYWDFLRLCRDTKDGFTGKSVIETNGELIALAYNTMRFEHMLMDTGGNKKGFLKSARKLTKEAMQEIKNAWRDLYSRSTNNMMILNDGIDYKETSATSTELQLNENKLTNNDALTMIFLLSARALQGASDDDIVSAVKTAVIPIIEQMEQTFNECLLLESEKPSMYWACDTSALERGDILKRFQAYKLAVEGKWMQADEIRYKEDMPALGLNWITLGLDDVLYDPKSGQLYTPNTNAFVKMGESIQQINDELRTYDPEQPRGDDGRWIDAGGGGSDGERDVKKLQRLYHHNPGSGSGGSANNSDKKSEESVDKSAESDIINIANQEKLKKMIENGEVTTTINETIQNRHFKNTDEYKSYLLQGTEKSYFTIPQSELQVILNEKAATGDVVIGKTGIVKETFDTGRGDIAFDTLLKRNTSFVKVFYSKHKTHMTPFSPDTRTKKENNND